MTANDLLHLLSAKYPAPGWAFLTQVANGTGFTRKQLRRADAVAFSLWPSRGYELHGFEIKISRSDWQAELRQPEKADEIARFCDRWYIVAPAGIVDPKELPKTWGLMTASGNGLRIKVVSQRKPMKPDLPMLAAILRRAGGDMIPAASVRQRELTEFERGRESERASLRYQLEEADKLQKAVEAFEEKSGIGITSWPEEAGKIGEVVRLIREKGTQGYERRIEWIVESIKHLLADAEKVQAELKKRNSA